MTTTKKIWFSSTASLLTLSLVVFFAYQATQHFIKTASWVDHTYQVVSLIDTAIKQFNDAETGQRGYLLTGDPSYLEPYEKSTAEIPSTLSRTRFLTRDNPRQQQRVDEIEMLSTLKLLELKETIDVFNAGDRGKALEIIWTDRGKQVMDNIRAVIQDMRAEEERLLVARKLESESALRRAIAIGSFGSFLVMSLVVASAIFIKRDSNGNPVQHGHAKLEIETLNGTLHICTFCKAIRNNEGGWDKLETFFGAHLDNQLSEGVCLKCMDNKTWR